MLCAQQRRYFNALFSVLASFSSFKGDKPLDEHIFTFLSLEKKHKNKSFADYFLPKVSHWSTEVTGGRVSAE